jgi:TDG/mug DNA glycosylase family protein
MATEEIAVNGQTIITLKELLRPGLKAVFVGLNPAKKSVQLGHYYQGRHGQHLWNQLRKYQIVSNALPPGSEDDAAFADGFGFADLVRRPTGGDEKLKLTREQKEGAAADLARRLAVTRDRPLIAFRYKTAWDWARAHLDRMGYRRTLYMPCPSTSEADSDALMKQFQSALRVDPSAPTE